MFEADQNRGSNADNVLTDAYVKNLSSSIPWQDALTAIIRDAEIEPINWSNEGRGGLVSWHDLNYIPADDYDYLGFGVIAHSISRTLEYAYNDFNLAQIGKGLGLQNYTTYMQRSGAWRNLFKSDTVSYLNGVNTNFTGFFPPKYMNGTWGYQDPAGCSSVIGDFCSLTSNPSETFESSVWEYTL